MSKKKRRKRRRPATRKPQLPVACREIAREDQPGSEPFAESDSSVTTIEPSTRFHESPRPLFYLNTVERIGGILVAPQRTLRFVLEEQDWIVPTVAVLTTALMIGSLRVGADALEAATDVREFLHSAPQLLILFALAQVTIPWMIQSAAMVGVARLHGAEPMYVGGIAVLGYARFPSLINATLATLLALLGKGGAAIARFLDFGLVAFLPRPRSLMEAILGSVLSNFTLANLWGFVVMVLAVECLAEVPRRRAIAITASYSALVILLQNLIWMIPASAQR